VTLETPLFMEPSVGDPDIPYTAQQSRALFDVMSFLPGVTLKNDLKVSQRAAGANLSVDVAAGSAMIPGSSVAYQGKYLCRSTAPVNVPLVGGVPSSGTRTDLIVAQVFDDQADGSGQYAWSPVWVPGTTSAPANSIPLAKVVVGSGISSILTAAIDDTPRLLNTLGDVPLWQRTGGNGQSIPNLTNTIYNGWTFSDLIGMDTTGGSAGDVITRQAGRYAVSFCVRITNGGTVQSEKAIFIEQVRAGSVIRRVASVGIIPHAMQTAGMPLTATGTARCNAGDTLRAAMYQSSGVTLNITDAFNEASFTGVWVGP
jgi:hypothetical protein